MKKILLFVFSVLFVFSAHSQWNIADTNTDYTITFDATVSGVNNGRYDATDIVTTPASGDLDSNAWAVAGMSSGNIAFDASTTHSLRPSR